jgi:biopolymer transport protein ExbD
MIDVVFQLVIFFMLSSTLITRTGLELELPGATSARESVHSPVTLTVISLEEVYLGEERFTLGALDTLLQENPERFEDRVISIEADTSLPYGTMIHVLDILRRNGFRGANLVAQQREEL